MHITSSQTLLPLEDNALLTQTQRPQTLFCITSTEAFFIFFVPTGTVDFWHEITIRKEAALESKSKRVVFKFYFNKGFN